MVVSSNGGSHCGDSDVGVWYRVMYVVCAYVFVCVFVCMVVCTLVILVSIVASIPACHAGDPGSIAGREVLLFSLAPTIPFLYYAV